MFPTPFVIQRHIRQAGAPDRYGNDTSTWSVTVDVAVHGWSPPSSDNEAADDQGRTAVVRDLDVLAPPGTVFAPLDRATVAGDLYEVVGYPQDFTNSPFGWPGGVRINLKRVEG